MTDAERSIYEGYRTFLRTGSGQDLIDRLKTTEARYMMEGMKASSIELKGLALERMKATYEVRTMLDDLAKPPVIKKSKPAPN